MHDQLVGPELSARGLELDEVHPATWQQRDSVRESRGCRDPLIAETTQLEDAAVQLRFDR